MSLSASDRVLSAVSTAIQERREAIDKDHSLHRITLVVRRLTGRGKAGEFVVTVSEEREVGV